MFYLKFNHIYGYYLNKLKTKIIMANLTRAERHNRMLSKTFENYSKHQNSLPSCQLYNRFLDMAEEKMGITRSEARSKYGQYTVKQWETLLNLGWNKNNQTTN